MILQKFFSAVLMYRILPLIQVLFLTFFFVPACRACDVPVFRYALERWAPATYGLNVHVPVDLSAADGYSRESIQMIVEGANCTLEYVGVAGIAPVNDALKLELVYPGPWGRDIGIWSGQAAAKDIDELLDSPARREIAREIMDGASAVWVFLECPDKSRNETALGRLEAFLERNERELRLPESVARLQLSMSGNLRVAFPIVRVSRSDVRERAFVGMLLNSEPDLESYKSEPMAFPVFGRGRVLYALVGEGINEENVSGACAFLTGPCACEIKDSSPGMDLLFKVDWTSGLDESWVDASEHVMLSSLAALSGGVAGESSGPSLLRNSLISLLAVLLVVGGGSIILLRRIRRKKR